MERARGGGGGARGAGRCAPGAGARERRLGAGARRRRPGGPRRRQRSPDGVSHVAGLVPQAPRAWTLLLLEDEVASAEVANGGRSSGRRRRPARLARAARRRGFGASLRSAGTGVRLVRGPARIGLGRGLTPQLDAPGPSGTLTAHLEASAADTWSEAVDELEADAAVLAALLYAGHGRPLARAAVGAAMVAAARVLAAPRDRRRPPWSRWSLAVLAGTGRRSRTRSSGSYAPRGHGLR